MTILDELEYKEEKLYHPLSGDYLGTEYTAHIEFRHGFMITKEAEVRGTELYTKKTFIRRSREVMKSMLLKTAINVIEGDHLTSVEPKMKTIAGFRVPIVVLKDANERMLIVSPKEYGALLKAIETWEKEVEEEAYKKAISTSQSLE